MFFNSIEFYVLAAMTAAGIVAYFSRPASIGPARQFLLPGNLADDNGISNCPSIEITCNEDGTVSFNRHAINDIAPDGAVSLAVSVIGTNITIKERTIAGREEPRPSTTASFTIDFLGQEWYHLTYENEQTGLFAALTLHVRPGIHILKPLQ